VTLDVNQYQGPPSAPSTETIPCTRIDIQTIATGGLKGTTEIRCLDWIGRPHTDWLFGTVTGQSKWIKAEEITDAYLKTGWEEGPTEATGPNGESHIMSYVESNDNGWTATQIWGFATFDGLRRHTRLIIVEKNGERVTVRLVYDYSA
jgi:hypothetical protein